MKDIGMGCSFENAKELRSLYGINTLIVPCGPDEMCVKKNQMKEFQENVASKDLIPYDVALVTHGPIWYNLCSKEKKNAVFFHLKMLCEYASMMNISQFVIHPGHKGNLDSFEAFSNCVEFLAEFDPILEQCGVKLLLENCAGSANGAKFGTMIDIRMVMDVVRSKNIGYCFDTAHAFANGEPVNSLEYWKEQVAKASLIHLNCPDPKVRFGSHYDRHSATSLANWDTFFHPDSLGWISSEFEGLVVMESIEEVALSDLIMLRKKYGNQV